MSLIAFTVFHVVLSLIGIGSGLVILAGMLHGRRQNGWHSVFLWTTLATSVTGFLFPFQRFLPSHAFGILSLIVLGAAFPARYYFRLSGGWGRVYAGCAMLALYLNVFVLVVQSFSKVPFLHDLAPTQSEPAFVIAQSVTLIVFAVLGYKAVSNAGGAAMQAAPAA